MADRQSWGSPWWLTLLIVVLMLPAVGIFLIDAPGFVGAEETMALVRLYPVYVLATGVCAWICYNQRPVVTWILLALLVLSHAGVYYLLTTQPAMQ